MKKPILIIITLIICNLSFAEKIPIPELKSPITDLTQTLNKNEINQLKHKLLNFENNNTAQIVVLLIPSTGEESIEEYSIRLAENWKIGSAENDDGIILLIAKNDRELRIEVGYGLETTVTDAEAQYITDELITPKLKEGDFYTGINNGIDAIIEAVKGNIILSETDTSNINKNKSEDNTNLFIPYMFILIISIMMPFFFFKRNILFFLILLIIIFTANYFISKHIDQDLTIIFTIFSVSTTTLVILIKLIVFILGKLGITSGSYSGSSGLYTGSSGNWSSSSNKSISSSSYSSGSSAGSSYSGGGGSFGGGGASGSW